MNQDNPLHWTVHVLTLFPEIFPGLLNISLIGKALRKNIWGLNVIDLRSFGIGKHCQVDDSPFGGGSGMIIRADVIDAALSSISECKRLVFFSARGHCMDQRWIKELSSCPFVCLICGRYEGMDDRIIQARQIEEVSLGDFVMSSGEPAALAVIDACVRLLPGVIGNSQGLEEESFVHDLLEYPHYTKPSVWVDHQGHTHTVPKVLLSGHHERIRTWRYEQAKSITAQRRPDLWQKYMNRKKDNNL